MQSARSLKDTSVKLFTSEMVGAPVLTQTAGTLNSVLSGCLVNGFGMQQVSSFVVAAGVGKITVPVATGWERMCVIDVAGCADASYNGEYKLTEISENGLQVSFPIDAPDGMVLGAAITVKLAGAGWLLRFFNSSTNRAVYMPSVPQWAGHCLWVNDVRSSHARVRGYETMTGVDTGLGAWPTNAQISGGGYFYKAWGTVRPAPWAVVCDALCFYLGVAPGVSVEESSVAYVFRAFGRMDSLLDADLHAVVLTAQADASLDWGAVGIGTLGVVDGGLSSSVVFSRSSDGVRASVQAMAGLLSGGLSGDSGNDTACGANSGLNVGRLIFAQKYLRVSEGSYPRARFPGLLHMMHTGGMVAPAAAISGRLHRFWASVPSWGSLSATEGALPIDVEGPWR